MTTKFGRMVTNLGQLLPVILLYPLVKWPCEIIWQIKTSTTSAYSHQIWQDGDQPSGTPTCNITLPFGHVVLKDDETNEKHISITTMPMTIKPAEVWLTMKSSYQQSHMTFKSRGLVRLRDKLKSLYLHFYNVYGHKAWHDGDLTWTASHDFKITWSCKITWQTKFIIYQTLQCLWLSGLAGCRYIMRSFFS